MSAVMTTETCEDCGRPFATGVRSYNWGGACGLQLSRSEHNDTNELELNCRTVQVGLLESKLTTAKSRIAELEAALGKAERENEAWRALWGWGAKLGNRCQLLYRSSSGAWCANALVSMKPVVCGTGDTLQAAVIDLATKLQLIKMEPER